jgi:hypothetical protein
LSVYYCGSALQNEKEAREWRLEREKKNEEMREGEWEWEWGDVL